MVDSAWIEAMQEEIHQFERLDKRDEENIVIRNKACLVAKGYGQQEGIDFEESFAPCCSIGVVKQQTHAKLYTSRARWIRRTHIISDKVSPSQKGTYIDSKSSKSYGDVKLSKLLGNQKDSPKQKPESVSLSALLRSSSHGGVKN
ncbi:hypothetical protein Tco_1236434 [Tanacetum coccineum]